MKSTLLWLLALPLAAHPGHAPSIHRPQADLEPAHRSPAADNRIEIRIVGDRRRIIANGIPDHPTGRFPNRDNPNAIHEQAHRFSLPLHPEAAARTTPLRRQPFGIALNGVLFDPNTAEFYRQRRESPWNYEALGDGVDLGLDEHHAHVQPNGNYHYHGLPTALFERLSGGEARVTLLGWAADGFPIYGLYGHEDPSDPDSRVVELESSYRLKPGRRQDGGGPGGDHDGTFTADYEFVPGAGDLDECNGRFGVTPEFPAGTYHYLITRDYPFIPRLFRGTPDPSFERRGPSAIGDPRRHPFPHPPGTPPFPPGPPPHDPGGPPTRR